MSEMLREMLSYCRPSGSVTEEQFVTRFIDVLDPLVDEYGNRTLVVGPDNPRVMFASHFDTVHMRGGRQKIRTGSKGDIIATSKHSNCLGADDTTGVYIMLKLIEAEVPGLYIFHYGEEVGCIGAQGIANHDPFNVLNGVDMSIEFDRRGYTSLVTHQMGRRCASDAFGNKLAEELKLGHLLDSTGVFTDNCEYSDVIPEVVNISVGYFDQHTSRERQCPVYVEDLIQSLQEVDFESLPIERDPTVQDHEQFSFRGRGWTSAEGDYEDLLDMVVTDPDATANMLWEYGFDADDIAKHHKTYRRGVRAALEEEDMSDNDIAQALADQMADEEWWEDYQHGYCG